MSTGKIRLSSAALLKALKDAGVPQRAVATKLAIAPSAVSMLFKGERALKHDEAIQLQELLGLNDERSSGRHIPVIGMTGAGKWLEAIEVARKAIWVPAGTEGTFAVEVVGDSMNILLPEGSIAIIDPEQTEVYGGKLYLLRNAEGEATIKRYRTDPSRFEPVSDNPEYVPFSIGSTDFRVIGRVTGGMTTF